MNEKHTLILLRKFLHLVLLVPVGMYWFLAVHYSEQAGLYALIGILLAGLSYEFLRLETSVTLPLVRYTKDREKIYHVDGINLLLSIVIVHAVFNPLAALSASLIAILGDAVSTLGRLYGRVRVGSYTLQTWEGITAAFGTDVLICILVLGPVWYVGLLAAVAVIMENILTTLDDNLAVPLAVASLAQIMITL